MVPEKFILISRGYCARKKLRKTKRIHFRLENIPNTKVIYSRPTILCKRPAIDSDSDSDGTYQPLSTSSSDSTKQPANSYLYLVGAGSDNYIPPTNAKKVQTVDGRQHESHSQIPGISN